MSKGGHTDLLRQFGLARNPFVDRTAEKTSLDPLSLYVHSDLHGFTPSETTYIFFGRRGSGKTTIRLQMQRAYAQHNEAVRAAGTSRGIFVIDLSRPGHLTACLRTFQETIGATDDNWDASFSENWSSADMVDCMLSYALTQLVAKLTDAGSPTAADMLARLKADPRARKTFLLLAHLYARTDASSLAGLRSALIPPPSAAAAAGVAAGVLAAASAGAALASAPAAREHAAAPLVAAWDALDAAAPALTERPLLLAGLAGGAAGGAAWLLARRARRRALERAAAVSAAVRVVRQQPAPLLARLLSKLYAGSDGAETIRGLTVGISAHQKLERLAALLRTLGYEDVAVFGDCFDEVVLLDPVQYPGAIKVFAREICRNDLLNFGRMHFFFPDSRLALDLNTDKTLKEARFDRHFVRDLTWSRHQLEELAERRFLAAQIEAQRRAAQRGNGKDGAPHEPTPLGVADVVEAAGKGRTYTFADLFEAVRVEDFSSYLSKLATPRELMIMMTEMMSRMEAHPEGGLTAQDMEISVTKALEQAV